MQRPTLLPEHVEVGLLGFARHTPLLGGLPLVELRSDGLVVGVPAPCAAGALLGEPREGLVLLGVRPGQELVVSEGASISEAEVELVCEARVRPVAVTEKGTVAAWAFTSCATPNSM